MPLSRWLGALVLPLVLLAPPFERAEAARHKRVEWTNVEVRPTGKACPAAPKTDATSSTVPASYLVSASCLPGAAARVARKLKKLLVEASRRADWGKGSTVKLSASVTELSWQQQQDVLRLEVTVVGRIAGAASVRSRIRVGGRPAERAKLEQDALQIVATGLVTRLADIARTKRGP